MRYDLSWTWNSAAMGCHAALEEIGTDYTMRFIDFDNPWPEQDLALNPNHKVPTLVDTNGGRGEETVVIYQSAAILLYLADNHPEAGLIPPVGSPSRGLCYQWLFFMAEMLQPSYQMFYYPERTTADDTPSGHQAVEEKAIEWVGDIWRRIDRAIGDKTYLLAEGLSICDLYMLPMAMWNGTDERFPSLDVCPNLTRTLAALKDRPAVQRMMQDHIQV